MIVEAREYPVIKGKNSYGAKLFPPDATEVSDLWSKVVDKNTKRPKDKKDDNKYILETMGTEVKAFFDSLYAEDNKVPADIAFNDICVSDVALIKLFTWLMRFNTETFRKATAFEGDS